MAKLFHEVRDPIHIFIRFDDQERAVVNSRPFQRLRHIHQLALSYLVYPGATHRRFEHSLGVMELATRVFDVITQPEATDDKLRELLPEMKQDDMRRYWRRVVRMAALCHDLGHLPFLHAAEKDLLPDGYTHERLTRDLIMSPEMGNIWGASRPQLVPGDIVRVALGPREAPDLSFSPWETILSEIIVGPAFGVDRMDYLLRDSHHAGVAYGRFDHYRLIDTLRILPQPGHEDDSEAGALALGVEECGVQSAEALLLARYYMFSQVYLHPVRRIYDRHLMDFLTEWLPGGRFPTRPSELLRITDNEVTAAFLGAAVDHAEPGHDPARRIVDREHFRRLYSRNPEDVRVNPEAGRAIAAAAAIEFGAKNVRHDRVPSKDSALDFPVKAVDGRVVSALSISPNISTVPSAVLDTVYIEPTLRDKARRWLGEHRSKIIELMGDDEESNGQDS